MSSSYQTLPPAVAGSPLTEALIGIAAGEECFRLQERSHRRMQREAAKFLMPAPLEGLARTHAAADQSWRQSLARLREEVGTRSPRRQLLRMAHRARVTTLCPKR